MTMQLQQRRLTDYPSSGGDTPSVQYVAVIRSRTSRFHDYRLQYSHTTMGVDAIPDMVHDAAREHADRRRTGHVLDIIYDSETDEILHIESDMDALYGLPARYLGIGTTVPGCD